MYFEKVVGQNEVKTRLLHMAESGQIPHALLLTGPQGCGKMALALSLASHMLCPESDAYGPCGHCKQCHMMTDLVHPDLHFSFPVIKPAGASGEYKASSDDHIVAWRAMLAQSPYFTIQDWLEAMNAANQQAIIGVGESVKLLRQMALKSSQGGYKIAIIWMPERMNVECANKLLKLLEEPPAGSLFILVSEEPEKLLPTIISRTQELQIKPISTTEITQALTHRALDADNARRIAEIAQGSWTKALEILNPHSECHAFLQMFIKMMRLVYLRDLRGIKKTVGEITEYGREKQLRLIDFFLRMFRESFVYNFGCPQLNHMTLEEEKFVRNFAKYINEKNILNIVRHFELARRDIRQNAGAKIVFFDLALRLILSIK